MTEFSNHPLNVALCPLRSKPDETQSTLILVLQDEQICTLCIDDLQIRSINSGIQQALKQSAIKRLFII